AGLGGEVEDALGVGVAEHALGVLDAGQIVLGAARGDDVVTVALEPLDEVRPEEPAPAGDQDPAHLTGALCCALASQSTRPIHLSRFAAYQAIVLAMPSSQETSGSQPVSRPSFSYPTRSAITSVTPGRRRSIVVTISRPAGQWP